MILHTFRVQANHIGILNMMFWYMLKLAVCLEGRVDGETVGVVTGRLPFSPVLVPGFGETEDASRSSGGHPVAKIFTHIPTHMTSVRTYVYMYTHMYTYTFIHTSCAYTTARAYVYI